MLLHPPSASSIATFGTLREYVAEFRVVFVLVGMVEADVSVMVINIISHIFLSFTSSAIIFNKRI